MSEMYSFENSMKPDIKSLVKSVDPDQLASLVNSVDQDQLASSEASSDQDPHCFQCNILSS